MLLVSSLRLPLEHHSRKSAYSKTTAEVYAWHTNDDKHTCTRTHTDLPSGTERGREKCGKKREGGPPPLDDDNKDVSGPAQLHFHTFAHTESEENDDSETANSAASSLR